MENAFAFAVSQSDHALLERTKKSGLRAYADLDPTQGGLLLKSNSGLAAMWTFSEDLEVAAAGIVEWKPKDHRSQHTAAIAGLLDSSTHVGARVQQEWSWEIQLSTEDHAMLESAARRGFVVSLDLANGISVSTPAGDSIEWSFISEVAVLNTLSGDLFDSFCEVEVALQALVAMEKVPIDAD